MMVNTPGISVNGNVNENLGVTAAWFRLLNDNYSGKLVDGTRVDVDYLDNMDFFLASLPMNWDGWRVTHWVMYGLRGRNAFNGLNGFNGGHEWSLSDIGHPQFTYFPYLGISGMDGIYLTTKPWGSMFWLGLPLTVTAFDGWKFKFNFNYGFVQSMGQYSATKYAGPNFDIPVSKRSSTQREGWYASAFLERMYDWGNPGIFGWYSSGDSGDPSNGSQRMPVILGYGNYTSMMGDGNRHTWRYRDINSTYTGTWGIGGQIRELRSFIENVDHTLKVVWWGGTNNINMVKFMKTAYSWQDGNYMFNGPYMTTNDGLH